MLNISVKTSLKAEEALERSYSYFTEKQGLVLVEWIAHFHAEEGACDLRISGGTVKGNKEYDSKEMLLSQAAHLREKYGFNLVYYGLHFHNSTNVDVGHLMVSINDSKPVEIELVSQEMDYQVREFIDKIPKAKQPLPVR
jgi:hypothetical protein